MKQLESIRVLVVDDHSIIRVGLKSLLEREARIQVVGEAEDGRTAVRLATELSPHVVVMDVSMPDLNGIEATRQILAQDGTRKVLVLSAHTDRNFINEMFQAGASGYITKTTAFEELTLALRAVMAGGVYLSPTIAGALVESVRRQGDGTPSSTFSILSSREREALQLIAEGKSLKEVATILKVSVKTVEAHRRKTMEKLNLHSVAELTKYAIRQGMTTSEF